MLQSLILGVKELRRSSLSIAKKDECFSPYIGSKVVYLRKHYVGYCLNSLTPRYNSYLCLLEQ